ncbi:MAG: hypothetical protein DRI57_30730 [Deltaproteobacteria bacterium]|nr:MAG: hypothetical protein DRI57_30730 [Deltaproteobacteria bacterium]
MEVRGWGIRAFRTFPISEIRYLVPNLSLLTSPSLFSQGTFSIYGGANAYSTRVYYKVIICGVRNVRVKIFF